MMEERELTRIIAEKLDRALNASDGGISQRRQDMFDRYMGAKEGNERAGYSSFVTREVLEAVEWAMPVLMRVFTGGDKYVIFDPASPDDEDAAKQETDIINHLLQKANGSEGFLAIYSFVKDALINPTAYAKVYVEEQERIITREGRQLTAMDLQKLMEDENIEITEQESEVVQVPGMNAFGQPMMQEVELFDVKYKQTDDRPKLRLMSVPGEEVLIDDQFTGQDLDMAHFVAHRVRKTRTELIRMGYDEDEIDAVGEQLSSEDTWNDERTHRLFFEDEHPDDEENELDETMQSYWVHEVCMDVDYDDDGIAEYRRIVLIGHHVFENEETDYQPMVSMCSSIVPHKHTGLSLAEMVEDLQRLLTTLTRQLLDNVYHTNTNRKFFSEQALLDNGETMDAMLDPQSEWIPVHGSVRDAVMPEQPQSVIDQILPVIQHAQAATSMRTGVAPENNMDPNVVQESTYGAFMGALEKAGERIEMIARVMAETGMKQLFRKAHVLARTHPDIAQTVKLRGQWVQMDPTSWQDRTDMTVRKDLGVRDKQQIQAMVTALLQIQQEIALPMGLANPQNIYNALELLTESANAGHVSQFFIDPSTPGWQPPQPDPPAQDQLYMAQAQAVGQEQERKKEELHIDAQLEGRKTEIDAEKGMQDVNKAQAETQIKWKELEIKERELALKEQELMLKRIELEKMGAETANTDADTELKGAQVIKTLADADKAEADAAATLNPPKDPNKQASPNGSGNA